MLEVSIAALQRVLEAESQVSVPAAASAGDKVADYQGTVL